MFIGLVEQMPANGLILDVCDNGVGYIGCGERLLQILTPRSIEPERLQFINTPLTLQICKASPDLKPWLPSIERAMGTGATFSASFPLTSVEDCNSTGQRYYGPVVLVTNALCYGTTDIFAATDRLRHIEVPPPPAGTAKLLELRGYKREKLVAARKIALSWSE